MTVLNTDLLSPILSVGFILEPLQIDFRYHFVTIDKVTTEVNWTKLHCSPLYDKQPNMISYCSYATCISSRKITISAQFAELTLGQNGHDLLLLVRTDSLLIGRQKEKFWKDKIQILCFLMRMVSNVPMQMSPKGMDQHHSVCSYEWKSLYSFRSVNVDACCEHNLT